MSGAPLSHIVQQHVEETVMLRGTRAYMVHAPNVGLRQLARMDERLAAHLDGIAVAGEYGARLAGAVLENPGRGECFTVAVRSLEDGDSDALARVFTLARQSPEGQSGLISAFGWVSPAALRGVAQKLLGSTDPFSRQVGLATFGMHRVDPPGALAKAVDDEHPAVRCQALRALASLGHVHLLPKCVEILKEGHDDQCAYEAAKTAVLLGEQRSAFEQLERVALRPGRLRSSALRMVLQAHAPDRARGLLSALSRMPGNTRLLLSGAGATGDPYYVPWLIEQMRKPKLARLAGESFCLITGLDLSFPIRELPQPDDVEAGPEDDPQDDDVAMDEDDGLPWPDAEKIAAWWQDNAQRFAAGARYFMGQPPTVPHCLNILKTGFQRQRESAALHLCFLKPGTLLFNTAAPAWRQKRWLGATQG